MNILHISRTMGQGGAEKVVYQICKEVNENMFIASTGGSLEEELTNSGVKHYTIPDINGKNPFIMIKTFIILKKIIKKEKIDIIHSHHRMAAFYSRLLCLFNKKIKRVYTAHNVFYNKKKLLNFSLKGSKIIAVGNGVKNNLINFYNIDSNNIEVIYNSIEKPLNINDPQDEIIKNKGKKKFIGTIGRLSDQKGIDVFLKAMSLIIQKDSETYGFIIGDGELRNELESLCNNLNIQNNIIFLGYRRDVLSLIKCMDFIVLASRWEGFPLTPIETFMVGKTIIVSNIDGNNEIVIDNYNGLLFEKDNVKELANNMEILLNEKDKLKKLEKNAVKDYLDKYSYKTFIEKYSRVYRKK